MTDLPDWTPLDWTAPDALEGRYARLERLSVDLHVEALYAANPIDVAHWEYLPYGPFPEPGVYRLWAEGAAVSPDPLYYAVCGAAGWSGLASYMRVDRTNGVIEIGNIAFSPGLQRTPASTEVVHLMLDHAFTAGFRRVEWKCNSENAPSRRAAERLGFTYEGTFHQHMIVKGQNRDTAWFAIIDSDWPAIRAKHVVWLDPSNFDATGKQLKPLRL